MVNSTSLFFLQLNLVNSTSALSKILASAVQKVEKILYIQSVPTPDCKLAFYNQIINQMYHSSSKLSHDRLDTRILLSNFRDSLMGLSTQSQNQIQTSHKIDKILSLNHGAFLASSLLNADPSLESEVLVIDNVDKDDSLGFKEEGVSPDLLKNLSNLAPDGKMYQHVVLGGTFDRLHVGHKILLSAAVLRCKESLTIGVTDGTMIQTKKLWELIEPCQTRIDKLKEFLMDVEPRLEYRIVPITDPYGPTAYDPALQVILETNSFY